MVNVYLQGYKLYAVRCDVCSIYNTTATNLIGYKTGKSFALAVSVECTTQFVYPKYKRIHTHHIKIEQNESTENH